ncbi:hypothetical protein ACOSP7_013785 [Xanthoceras sorbifolium]
MKDVDDIVAYRKSIEQLRVHIFLAGLDGTLEQVRGEILRKDPIPDLEECYALVRREAVGQTTLKGEYDTYDISAMVAQRSKPINPKANPVNKSSLKCTNCKKAGHIKDNCFELVGYPYWWNKNRERRNKDYKQTPSVAVVDVAEKTSALIAATDNGKVLNISAPIMNSTWIIDSGATDHMTFDSKQVSSFKFSLQKVVSTANGNTTPVIGEGPLTLTEDLYLDYVLVVPSLDYNLLSVSQITTSLSCVVIFWPDFCVFKDIETRQTISYGIKRGKLYYLDLQLTDAKKCTKP